MSHPTASNPDRKDPANGSPSSGEPIFLAVGKLRRPHGVSGEVQMEVLSGFPERMRRLRTVYIGEAHTPYTVTGVRGHNQLMLLSLKGFTTPEEVGTLRNQLVFVRADALPPLPEGEYYHHELIGLRVVDETGKLLGTLNEILETGANDVYVVKPEEGPDLLLPVIADVILGVDLEKGEMRVRPPSWE